MSHYILEGKTPKKAENYMEWLSWFKDSQRTLEYLILDNDYVVSTVFLGVDHNYSGEGDPILFETMVFDPDGEGIDTWRYTTWDEALIGHCKMVGLYLEKEFS